MKNYILKKKNVLKEQIQEAFMNEIIGIERLFKPDLINRDREINEIIEFQNEMIKLCERMIKLSSKM